MGNNISLGVLWKSLKKCWILMVIVALVVAIAVGAVVSMLPEKYSSSVEFFVVNTNTSYDYTTSALLAASEYLINDYTRIIKSDQVLKVVADEVNKDKPESEHLKASEIKSMISFSSEENTSLFTVKVTHTKPGVAKEVATAIMEITPALVTEIAKPDRLTNEYLVDMAWSTMVELERAHLEAKFDRDVTKEEAVKMVEEKYEKADVTAYLKNVGLDGSLECFTAVNNPEDDEVTEAPDTVKYALVGAVFSAVAVYLIFIIKGLLSMNITTEDDVKQYINRPLVGTIPHWGTTPKK